MRLDRLRLSTNSDDTWDGFSARNLFHVSGAKRERAIGHHSADDLFKFRCNFGVVLLQ